MTQPTAQDEVMMGKALVEARTALANGEAGIAALLLWGDKILALDTTVVTKGIGQLRQRWWSAKLLSA